MSDAPNALAGLAPDDAGYVLAAAVESQLPHRTYGSAIVAGAVIAAAPHLTPEWRANIARDLRRALAEGRVRGEEGDQAHWRRALAAVEGPHGA